MLNTICFVMAWLIAITHGDVESECMPSTGAEASRRFAYELYAKAVEKAESSSNVFLAPTTVASALSMVIAGAGGETKEQIWSGLMLQNTSRPFTENDLPCLLRVYNDDLVQESANERSKDNKIVKFENPLALRTASRLFGEKTYGFSDSFVAKTASYGAELKKLNFKGNTDASREGINNWVALMTENKIKDLFSSDDITAETKLAIVSALYFKGLWQRPFPPQLTATDDFNVDDNTKVTAEFMSTTSRYKTLYSETLEAEMLELPYKADAFQRYNVSMIVLLPLQSMEIVEQRLTEENLAPAIKSLFAGFPLTIALRFPKFKMSLEYKLKDILESMGMVDMFSPGLANFSAMTDSESSDGRPLYVSSAVHKTFVEVDETGTVAAGATGFGIIPLSLPQSFICNRPFLTIIYEKISESVLFIGKVNDPTA